MSKNHNIPTVTERNVACEKKSVSACLQFDAKYKHTNIQKIIKGPTVNAAAEICAYHSNIIK